MLSVDVVSINGSGSITNRYWGKVIAALAAGVLLGVLAVMPYESWIPAGTGMTGSIGTVVRSLIVAIGLSGLHVVSAEGLVFDVNQL
jgi:hypothetical protein